MTRKDPVTPELREAVLARDDYFCVAWLLGATGCEGRLTLDHVHGQNEMGVGKPRAKSDMAHLVSVCEGHSERGAKGGRQWNTSHRPALREYLARVSPLVGGKP